jgi:hypothetical protein
MPLPIIEFSYIGTVHSPFSGLPADSEDGPNETDPTLLFTYYGDASEYGFISPRLGNGLAERAEDLEPIDLAEALQVEGGIVMVVDCEWNGVNYYGFAPADSKITSTPAH